MPVYLLTRLAAVGLTAAAMVLLQERTAWLAFVYIVAFGHYAMALLYSRRHVTQVMSLATGRWALPALALGGLLLYYNGFSLTVFFGVHHVLNEVYLWDRNPPPEKASVLAPLKAASFWFHSFIYIWLMRARAPFAEWDQRLLAAGLALSACVFLYNLVRAAPALTRSELLDRSGFELSGLLLCLASFYYGFQLRLTDMVAYHILFWTLYPIPGLRSRGSKALKTYAGQTFALTGLAFLVSPFGLPSYDLSGSFFEMFFFLTSYLHIAVSFALSDANPLWLRRAFKPA